MRDEKNKDRSWEKDGKEMGGLGRIDLARGILSDGWVLLREA